MVAVVLVAVSAGSGGAVMQRLRDRGSAGQCGAWQPAYNVVRALCTGMGRSWRSSAPAIVRVGVTLGVTEPPPAIACGTDAAVVTSMQCGSSTAMSAVACRKAHGNRGKSAGVTAVASHHAVGDYAVVSRPHHRHHCTIHMCGQRVCRVGARGCGALGTNRVWRQRNGCIGRSRCHPAVSGASGRGSWCMWQLTMCECGSGLPPRSHAPFRAMNAQWVWGLGWLWGIGSAVGGAVLVAKVG